MTAHPVAGILRSLTVAELRALREDIEENGILRPIEVTDDGSIVDGRHRKLIADELGIECPTIVVKGDDATLAHRALTANLAYRKLTKTERAEVALTCVREFGMSQRAVARLLGVGLGTVSRDATFSGVPNGTSEKLTKRRAEVAALATQGFTAPQIADNLGIPVPTAYRDLAIAKAQTEPERPRPKKRKPVEPEPPPVPVPAYQRSEALRYIEDALGNARSLSPVNAIAHDVLEAIRADDHGWVQAAGAKARRLQDLAERLVAATRDYDGALHYSTHPSGMDDR